MDTQTSPRESGNARERAARRGPQFVGETAKTSFCSLHKQTRETRALRWLHGMLCNGSETSVTYYVNRWGGRDDATWFFVCAKCEAGTALPA
jgi:hypothetical protein